MRLIIFYAGLFIFGILLGILAMATFGSPYFIKVSTQSPTEVPEYKQTLEPNIRGSFVGPGCYDIWMTYTVTYNVLDKGRLSTEILNLFYKSFQPVQFFIIKFLKKHQTIL